MMSACRHLESDANRTNRSVDYSRPAIGLVGGRQAFAIGGTGKVVLGMSGALHDADGTHRVAYVIAMLALVLGSGCATQRPLPASQIPEPKLSPASFGGDVSLAQRLSFERVGEVRGNRPRTLDVLLEIDSKTVRLAGIAMGQRILSLGWDGTTLTVQRHPQLPAQVDPARVLRDIQYAYWPTTAIEHVLPAGWSLQDGPSQRTLLHDGRDVLRIDYDASPRWNGNVRLDNRLEGYRLNIQSTMQETSAK